MVCGIIAEYNPMHNGHLYHLKESLKISGAKNCICVISGNFVQRGEPAICSKYARVRAALALGIDIVIELPVFYATSSAQGFARAAVKILADCGIVDSICFGSELGDVSILSDIAQILTDEPREFKEKLHEGLGFGLSFAKSRAIALSEINPKFAEVINKPNNILAVEYLAAIAEFNLNLKVFAVKRKLVDYHSNEFAEGFASASGIRKRIFDNGLEGLRDVMPEESFGLLETEYKRGAINHINNFSHILHYILKTTPKKARSEIADITEGLENRIERAASEHFQISNILENIASKRYAKTTLARGILHTILGITKQEMKYYENSGYPQYIRVLGFRRESIDLVKKMTHEAKIPVITNLQTVDKAERADWLSDSAKAMLARDIWLSEFYWLGLRAKGVLVEGELSSPVIL